MTPEQLAEIEQRITPGTAITLNMLIAAAATTTHPHAGGEPAIVQGCVVTSAAHLRETVRRIWFEDVPALLAEVELLREQVRVTRLVGENEAQRAAYEAMDAERRGWQSRRAVENIAHADLRRDRDRAREVAVALEQENARLQEEALKWEIRAHHAGSANARVRAVPDKWELFTSADDLRHAIEAALHMGVGENR